MRKSEDIVCYDFQGWPDYKMNLREIMSTSTSSESASQLMKNK